MEGNKDRDFSRDLCIDLRTWGEFKLERLFNYLQEYWRNGYKELPGTVLVTPEQRHYILANMTDAEMRIQIYNKLEPNLFRIYTPFNSVVMEVIREARTEGRYLKDWKLPASESVTHEAEKGGRE